jgi:gamma-glutamylcyclotransferase (GGCT)/AIG2-like uncharacterized protein YtfP
LPALSGVVSRGVNLKGWLSMGASDLASLPRLPLFVYGTLRPGEKNYPAYLAGRTRREVAATVAGALFFATEGGYPCLLAGEGRVCGELMDLRHECYEAALQELDALEEYEPSDEAGSVYLRRRARVLLETGEEAEAWVYYWNGPLPAGTWINSGDFRDRG